MDFKSMLLNETTPMNEAETVQVKDSSYVEFINHKRDKAMLYRLSAYVGKKVEKIIEINVERLKNEEVKITFDGVLAPTNFITLREVDLKGAKANLNQPYKDLVNGLEKFLEQINYLAKW